MGEQRKNGALAISTLMPSALHNDFMASLNSSRRPKTTQSWKRRPKTSQSMRSSQQRLGATSQSWQRTTDLEATGSTMRSAKTAFTDFSGTRGSLRSSCSDLQATRSTMRSQSTTRSHLPAHLLLEAGLVSTIKPPPTAQPAIRCDNPPEWVNPHPDSATERRRKVKALLKTPRKPPKLTTREGQLRRYNRQNFGEYEPLPMCVPEQQTRYLELDASKESEAKQLQNSNHASPSHRSDNSGKTKKSSQGPAKGAGHGRSFKNELYVEEPAYCSQNWRPMFRGGNDCMPKDYVQGGGRRFAM